MLERWKKHCQPKYKRCIKLHNAIQKYGKNNFTIGLLTITNTQECADYWESHFIQGYDSINSGYNLKDGGSRGRLSEESKKKTSKSLIGHTVSEETRTKISNAHIGKIVSKETKQKLSQRLIGNKRCVNRVPWNKGKPGQYQSEESKKKRSQSMKLVWETRKLAIKS
jgi:group I intron endonuclease